MTIYVANGSASAAPSFHGVQACNYPRFPIGAITLTNGSPNVVGSGTHFTTGIEAGYLLHNQTIGTIYTVSSITDDTHLTLTSNVTDTTGTYDCSPDFSVPNATFTRVPLRGSNNWDTDGFHFTDHSALSGTVTKSNASTTIVGSGTSFTTQLSLNQVVDIPGGGGTDTVVVKAITDNTHFTVWVNPAFSASAQTATKNPDCIAIPAGITNGVPGFFVAYLYQDWNGNGTGFREISLGKNLPTGTVLSAAADAAGQEKQGEFIANAGAGGETASCATVTFQATDGDFLSCFAYQNSGGSLGLTPAFTGDAPYGMTVQFLGVAA